jgi:hypothetical protein
MMVWAAVSLYSIPLVPMAKLLVVHVQLHPTFQMLFTNNDAVFQDNNAPIHTAGTVQSWFEEHEGELQHLPLPVQSPDLNIVELLWSVNGNE